MHKLSILPFFTGRFMPAKVYKVTLSDEEKTFLNSLTSKGKGAAQKLVLRRFLWS